MGFLPFPQGLEDLHIQRSTMSMLNVNTMEELGALCGELHSFQRQGSVVDQRRSSQIRKTCQRSPEALRQKDQLGAVFAMSAFICECTS